MSPVEAVLGVLAGFAAGVLAGMFGVGGGIVSTPAISAIYGVAPVVAARGVVRRGADLGGPPLEDRNSRCGFGRCSVEISEQVDQLVREIGQVLADLIAIAMLVGDRVTKPQRKLTVS